MTEDEIIDQADREARALNEGAWSGRSSDPDFGQPRRSPRITAGTTARERFNEDELHAGYFDHLLGAIPDRKRDRVLREAGLFGMPLLRYTKVRAAMLDEQLRMSDAEIAGQLVRFGGARVHIGMTTLDVQNGIIDATNRAALFGFHEAPEIWAYIARVLSTSDFKRAHYPIVSAVPTPEQVTESGEIRETTIQIAKESTQLGTFASTITITRQAVINGDFAVIGALAAAHGQAAARVIGDKVIAVLTSGTSTALAQDSVNLFDAATHRNYATAGASPSVATIEAGWTAMALQASNGVALGATPKYLLTPAALGITSKILTRAINSPGFDQPTDLIPLAERRLDAWNPQGWFLAADPMLWPSVGVAFLDGNSEPVVEQVKLGTVDGFGIRVRIDVAALALDYKGIYYNDGA